MNFFHRLILFAIFHFSFRLHNFFYRNNTKKTSKTSISNGFRVAICESDLKFRTNTATTFTTTATMTTTNADDDESDSETESSDSDADTSHNHLQLPTNNRGQDESSDFIQFQRTNDGDDGDDEDDNGGAGTVDDDDDAVDGANFSSIKDITHDKRLCKPNKNRANNNFVPGSLEFNETQPHLKLKWATLYIQMSFRPLTLRTWLDERNKHADFTAFHQKFIKKSVQQWDRTVINEDDIDGGNDVLNQNGGIGAEAAAITKFCDRVRRNITAPSPLSPTLEKNLSKQWDSLDVTLDIFVQALSGLRYIHLQNIVHHDIKPSNIFIGCEKNGELYVQLGDFGLACPLETKHSPDSMIGTITYAAPEQLKGQCNKKVRSPKPKFFILIHTTERERDII